MLQITESATGRLLALVEGEPWHVKEGASGALVHCAKGEATGVAVGGVAYKLADVALREIDGAAVLMAEHRLREAQGQELLNVQLAMCERYESEATNGG